MSNNPQSARPQDNRSASKPGQGASQGQKKQDNTPDKNKAQQAGQPKKASSGAGGMAENKSNRG